MPGIGYLTLMEDGSFKGPIDKFLSEEERDSLIKEFDMKVNSVMFFIANKKKKLAQKFAGQIRTELGRKLELIDPDRLELCIINDFPMFEWDDEKRKYEFCHNPFSMPHGGMADYENHEDVGDILAYQYDFVCNGNEMASGAIRNHDLESLAKGFEVVGYTREEVEERFHSRYSVKSKRYRYIINNSQYGTAIYRELEFHIPQKLNIEKMKEAAKYFEGEHDFKAFKASGTSSKSSVRTIYKAEVIEDGDRIKIELTGNGFLYNMVRIISGTLVDVGHGKIKPEEIKKIIENWQLLGFASIQAE